MPLAGAFNNTVDGDTTIWRCPTRILNNVTGVKRGYSRVKIEDPWQKTSIARRPGSTVFYYDSKYFGYPHWTGARPFWYGAVADYSDPTKIVTHAPRHGSNDTGNISFLDTHVVSRRQLLTQGDYTKEHILDWKKNTQ